MCTAVSQFLLFFRFFCINIVAADFVVVAWFATFCLPFNGSSLVFVLASFARV